jgi:hypothetical protein
MKKKPRPPRRLNLKVPIFANGWTVAKPEVEVLGASGKQAHPRCRFCKSPFRLQKVFGQHLDHNVEQIFTLKIHK